MRNRYRNQFPALNCVVVLLGTVFFLNSSCNTDTRASEPTSIASSLTDATDKNVGKAESTTVTPADAATILARPEVPILCYHQIRDYTASDSRTARAYIVPTATFAEQIKSLADSGYNAVLPDQVYDYLVYGKALPAKPVMITFDDTRLDQYTAALPTLDKYGFKAAFFIMTVSLGRPGYMSKEQVKALADQGHTIGSHTWNHNNVKKYMGDDWVTQVEKPAKQLEAITGKPIVHFAYPFGLWNKEGIPHLKEKGMKTAFQLYADRDANDPLYSIRRIIVPGSWSVSGLHHAMTKNFK